MSQRENLEAFLEHEEHLRMLAKNGEDGFMKEFMALKQQSMRYKTEKTYSTSEGEKEMNIRKNRYKDILPFDYTRIILPEIEDVEGSDYINANYISGIDNKGVYIAAQGPLPHTVNDFWRLLWETGVEVVIMACNEYENGKHKCEKYWADEGDTKQFGSIAVTIIRQLRVTPDFMIRTLKASKDAEERVLNQFHYTAWPDHGVPRTVQPIMDMIKLFREYLPDEERPVVMHCSAGCGRTGTMICIDYVRALLKAGMIGSDFCLYDIIMEMRRQRPAIVQTRDQYELVHRAVAWLFRKELGMAHNPNDYDHLYENVKLQNEGPRMPPGAGSLSPDTRTTPPFKLSPKQRRHKDKESDITHNYVNHTIQGKGSFDVSGGSSAAKVLKPPSLPTKQMSREAGSETIYANFQEKPDAEEEKGSVAEDTASLPSPAVTSPALTPRQSPLAHERFESGCKKIVAAFKEFEMPPSPGQGKGQGQGRASPPRSTPTETVKPRPRLKPTSSGSSDGRKPATSRSMDLDLALTKPLPPSKPALADKPAVLGDKPKPNAKPNLLAKPAIARKKDGASGQPSANQPVPLKRRPTSEPLSQSSDQGKLHLGATQFKHAKNLVEAKLTKPDSDSSSSHKDTDTGKRKESKTSRPGCAPPKPPVTHAKHASKPAPSKSQPYEDVCVLDSPSADKHDSTTSPRGFAYQIQPVATTKLQSHKEMMMEGKAGRTTEPPLHRGRTIDPSRPMQPVPDTSTASGGEEYSYAVQPISVAEKLKDAQSRPQLRTGQALAYADAYATEAKDPQPSKESATRITEDYSYASEVVIPMASGKGRGNVKKYPLQKAKSAQGDAYELIEVNGPPVRRSSDGTPQEESPVFDRAMGDYNEVSFSPTGPNTMPTPRSSAISSSTSWASFTDDEEDEDEQQAPVLPVKTAGAYEFVEGDEGDESGQGASSKLKITQFLSNQRDKISNHREKLASNTKGFFKQIGVARSTSTQPGPQTSPQAGLSSSPQAAIVSDLNELIKKTLREYEPTYKEEPTMYNRIDISFPKRVPKPKSPPPPPNGWSKPDTTSVHL